MLTTQNLNLLTSGVLRGAAFASALAIGTKAGVLSKSFCRAVSLLEAVLYGGKRREALLVYLLGALHRSQLRREWVFLSNESPHFYNQRWNGFDFTYGNSRNPYVFFRGFLISEVIQEGDSLLDIGCGDGFFSNTFFSARCRHIDAIDIEPSAIETAKRLNNSPKIDFHLSNAVRDPFPSECYDVIVWEGSIEHFTKSDLSIVLEKIVHSLPYSGIFVGSASLGSAMPDHLQRFEDDSALASVFKPYFKHVLIRTAEYRIKGGVLRREAYWRCTKSLSPRHESTQWIDLAEKSSPTS